MHSCPGHYVEDEREEYMEEDEMKRVRGDGIGEGRT
jgi:hypothetical protein